jgi:hypothetical protein
MRKSKYTIRFNLGRGARFKTWKVTSPDGDTQYLQPDEVCIVMHNCKLYNSKTTANKILDGANKTVCAWIEADNIEILGNVLNTCDRPKVKYNPRVTPNWVVNGDNADNNNYDELFTIGKEVILA